MEILMGILASLFIGGFALVVAFGMQKEYQQSAGKKIKSLDSGLFDSLPIKISAFGGALIGLGIGIFLGSIS